MVELLFLPSVYAPCAVCQGTRYNAKTLEITYNGKNIAEVLAMTVDEAWHFFESEPHIHRALNVVKEVGLGYLRLGQSATELSGGEAQRIKLATELQRVQKETGVTMIFVTHDQIEALALADRIVVMKGGKIEQIGTPEEIYNAPVSSFVADFVGFENIFALEGGALKTANGTTPLPGPVLSASGLAWRPRMVTLGSGPFQGTVRGTSFAGNSREYLLDTPLGPIKAETDAALTSHAIGDTLAFDLPVEKAASLKVFN